MTAAKNKVSTDDVREPSLRRRLKQLELTLAASPENQTKTKGQTKRAVPANDNQPDFFVPAVQDVPIKDGLDLMDIAVFRLAKSQTRKGDIIRHELPGVTVTVAGGAHGMATIMDYDVVLMMVSHLADETRRHRQGRGQKPSKIFRPNSVEVFKFCRVPKGGNSYDALEDSLRRLQGTFIEITRTNGVKRTRRTGYFPLLAGADVVSRTDSGRIATIEIIIPDWIYDSVTSHENPAVLTIDPDYFLLKKGLARFIYRLARKAAGNSSAIYSFTTVHARSGSTRPLKKFTSDLRKLIEADNLPGYHLKEVRGADGPQLHMQCREVALASSDQA
jgi:plasmid replication initiation protein